MTGLTTARLLTVRRTARRPARRPALLAAPLPGIIEPPAINDLFGF